MSSPTYSAYELMVEKLLQTKLSAEGFADLKAFHLKKYKGKSGQDHAIDVSFEVKLGELELLFLVECKEYKRKAGVDDMMQFIYRLRDIGAHKGILVTTHGFQEGAMTIAKAERVGLLVAAKGQVVGNWVSGGPLYFEFFTLELELSISPDAKNAEILGKPWQSGGAIIGATRLDDESQDILPNIGGAGAVIFLLPQEEPALDLTGLTLDAETPDAGLGRPTPLKTHFLRFARPGVPLPMAAAKSINIIDSLSDAD
jgi:hypothetical protein